MSSLQSVLNSGWEITNDGILDKDGINFSSYLPYIMFNSAHLNGVTLFNLLKVATVNYSLFEKIKHKERFSNNLDYIEYINWEKNKKLFYEKFGNEYENKCIVVKNKIIYDQEFDISYVADGMDFFLYDLHETPESIPVSLFGERLEKILDLPVKYDGFVFKNTDNELYMPMIMGKLFDSLVEHIFSLMEGSDIVDDKLKYLP